MISNINFVVGFKSFDIEPHGYLINGTDIDPSLKGMCVIGIMPNPDKIGDTGYTMFLLGDTFLRGFYSVYDFEDKSVKLAVNINAQSYVSITDRKN